MQSFIHFREISLDWGRFKAPEGLFNTEVWGMDNPPLQKLVQKAIQASPLDSRREMWRYNILLTEYRFMVVEC